MLPRLDAAQRIFYGGVILLYLVVLVGWFKGNGSMVGFDGGGLVALARLFGLLAASSVLLQVLLMSRTPLIDKRLNLHEIVRLHRWNGTAVVTFISLHIISMTTGYALLSHLNIWAQFMQLVTSYRDVFKALLAAILVFIATSLSIRAARRRVPYEFWYFVHLTLYAAILLAFFHQINTGGDIIRGDWFRYYWLALYIGVFGAWLYFRVLRIGIWALRYDFKIDRIVREAEGIYSVYVGGRSLRRFHYEPGQYAGWRILTRRTWWQNHPYSFSTPAAQISESDGAELRFTINQADGAFTRRIPELKPGARILIDGPRGSFTARRISGQQVVLVAGGIGVTPYISLIPRLIGLGHDVRLLYAVRTMQHAAFGSELKVYKSQGLQLEYYAAGSGKSISGATLRPLVNEDTTFYLCGPEGMVNSLRSALLKHGVPKTRVVTERFSV